jgi:hypothetical protein
MTGIETQTGNEAKLPRKRIACCAFGLLSFIIAGAAAAWLIHSSTSYSRMRVVVPTDPVSHCKLEYTISSRYSPQFLKRAVPGLLAFAVYAPKPPPKWIAWMQTHLDGRTVGAITVFGKHLNPRQIQVEDSWQAPGYIEPVMPGGNMKVIESTHILVSNCTAIWDVSEWIKPGNRRSRTYSLLVHPLGSPVMYHFGGLADKAEDREKIRAEMIAIRGSIKISGP